MTKMKSEINLAKNSCKQLLENQNILLLFSFVLTVGNYMNWDHKKYNNAVGFKFKSFEIVKKKKKKLFLNF